CFAVVSLYLVYGVAIGVAMPVKQAYLNAHIPSAQRATIISLDSMFASSGGVLGQTAWGWVARTRSIGTAWAWSGVTLLLGIPLYWLARRRDRHWATINSTHRRTGENSSREELVARTPHYSTLRVVSVCARSLSAPCASQ